MPLEPCPACGYALSILDHRCRHCHVPSGAASSSNLFEAKHLWRTILAVVLFGVGLYLIFIR
jgi:hypothetical protein